MRQVPLVYMGMGSKYSLVVLCVGYPNGCLLDGWLRMGLPPSRDFCRYILSCRELKAESFRRCLHTVLWGVSL